MNHRRLNKAFTLIELLVVIAIIAILAAILFPVFAQAKLAAKKAAALSNAKQVATGLMIYEGDFDDSLIKEFYGFPGQPCSDWPGGVNSYYSWRHAMYPYLKNTGILGDGTNPFSTPNYWDDVVDMNANGVLTDAGDQLPTNWAVNNSIIGFANGSCGGQWTPEGISSLDQVEDVAGTITILPNRSRWNDLKLSFLSTIEAKNDWCHGLLNTTTGVIDLNTRFCPADPNGALHAVGKQAAFIWADGHAKTKAPLATLNANDADKDDWSSKLGINPRTNAHWTQADRQDILANAWGEYK